MEFMFKGLIMFSLGAGTTLLVGIFLALNKVWLELAKHTALKEQENKLKEIEVNYYLKLDKPGTYTRARANHE